MLQVCQGVKCYRSAMGEVLQVCQGVKCYRSARSEVCFIQKVKCALYDLTITFLLYV